HLIDRSGMAHSIGAFGRDGMAEVAIEEWQLASPIYTRRMRAALQIPGDGVVTIFKGLQLDIGAPPQFMDFRYRVDDDNNGEFWLDHCGALADVEPMGEDYVVAMCHDIEDPTFDATALATNIHAQVRPIHRPPRQPADRVPVCAWTVRIDPANTPPQVPANAGRMAEFAAVDIELAPIVPGGPGADDYAGPLLSDLDFTAFSRSALIRMADEVCLQHHLLNLAFGIAVADRADAEQAADIARKQFTGIAGLTSERLRAALKLGDGFADLAQVLRLHPAWNPLPYVDIRVEADKDSLLLTIARDSAAVADGAWPSIVDADHLEPLAALVRGVNPHFDVCARDAGDSELVVQITRAATPFKESPEVAITRFSTGADFRFGPRQSLPLTVV
ncbi:MAG: hypothetical protein J2P18_04410, partial [Nocardia sp.]|nr:hypothetical protein [Nocardia sp.]